MGEVLGSNLYLAIRRPKAKPLRQVIICVTIFFSNFFSFFLAYIFSNVLFLSFKILILAEMFLNYYDNA